MIFSSTFDTSRVTRSILTGPRTSRNTNCDLEVCDRDSLSAHPIFAPPKTLNLASMTSRAAHVIPSRLQASWNPQFQRPNNQLFRLRLLRCRISTTKASIFKGKRSPKWCHFETPSVFWDPKSSICKGEWAQNGAILRRQTFLKTQNFPISTFAILYFEHKIEHFEGQLRPK